MYNIKVLAILSISIGVLISAAPQQLGNFNQQRPIGTFLVPAIQRSHDAASAVPHLLVLASSSDAEQHFTPAAAGRFFLRQVSPPSPAQQFNRNRHQFRPLVPVARQPATFAPPSTARRALSSNTIIVPAATVTTIAQEFQPQPTAPKINEQEFAPIREQIEEETIREATLDSSDSGEQDGSSEELEESNNIIVPTNDEDDNDATTGVLVRQQVVQPGRQRLAVFRRPAAVGQQQQAVAVQTKSSRPKPPPPPAQIIINTNEIAHERTSDDHNNKQQQHDPQPYSFNYAVEGKATGDVKSHSESSDGRVITGFYSLVEPDGTLRVVKYRADPINGFSAQVERTPNAYPPIPPPQTWHDLRNENKPDVV